MKPKDLNAMTKPVDSLSIVECVSILKNAPTCKTHHRKQDEEPTDYKYESGNWLYWSQSLSDWALSSLNSSEHQIESILVPLGDIRARCQLIVQNAPEFTREELNAPEAMYNTRTGDYVVRGKQSVLVSFDTNEYFRATMHYDSSFYGECVYLADLIEVTTLQHVRIENTVIA